MFEQLLTIKTKQIMKNLAIVVFILFLAFLPHSGKCTNGQTSEQSGRDSAVLAIPWFETRPGIIISGERAEVSASIHNISKQPLHLTATLEPASGLIIESVSVEQTLDLRPLETKRLVWQVRSAQAGLFDLKLNVSSGTESISSIQSLCVVAKHDQRHECQTPDGSWELYPDRPTLQDKNRNRTENLVALRSDQLKGNKFGITAHLPRSIDEEDPFNAAHLVDGDPETSWASRWWRVEIPSLPESIEIDLARHEDIAELRFLPSWMNSGAPAALKIEASDDGVRWITASDEPDCTLQEVGEGDPLRYKNLCWQRIPLPGLHARHLRISASRLRSGGTSFFCSPIQPYQFRMAEIAIIDGKGDEINLKSSLPKVSSTFHAWYNSPETINKTYPFLFNSGVKWNRTGQWGDKTDWATIEKVRGVYAVDPEMDQAITESVKNGVNIMMGLNYGNLLYQKMRDPVDIGPTWHRGHPFLQCAPTTDEAIEGFANYCRFMAKHFRGRVTCFEIWNEEDGWFMDAWADNNSVRLVKDYGRALLAAAKAVKEGNPEAVVVFGGVAGSSLDFPRIALDQGAGPYIDIFAFHPYGHVTPEAAPPHFLTETNGMMEWKPRPAEIADYEDEIAAFRKLLHGYNPNMEIWVNEMNWMAPGEPFMKEFSDGSELSQAKYLARFFTMNASLDCGAIWWSLFNANQIQEWAIMRSSDMSPRGAFYSAGYVSTILDDVRPTGEMEVKVIGSMPDSLKVKCFRNGKGEWIAALWFSSLTNDGFIPQTVSIRLEGITVQSADLHDALYGYSQKAIYKNQPGGAVFADLLVGDWPLFVRIKK